MKLTYRGIHYNHDPLNIEVREGEVAGKYRGKDWQYTYPQHIEQLQLRPKLFMQYRGVSYSTRPVVGEVTLEKQLKALRQSQQQTPFRPVLDDAAETHLNNIRRNLERRIQVAKANGNKDLVEMLEKESRDLAIKA